MRSAVRQVYSLMNLMRTAVNLCIVNILFHDLAEHNSVGHISCIKRDTVGVDWDFDELRIVIRLPHAQERQFAEMFEEELRGLTTSRMTDWDKEAQQSSESGCSMASLQDNARRISLTISHHDTFPEQAYRIQSSQTSIPLNA